MQAWLEVQIETHADAADLVAAAVQEDECKRGEHDNQQDDEQFHHESEALRSITKVAQ